MTVVQLECVLEAARQQNFSKAAANLYLSQPTLSRNFGCRFLTEQTRAFG